MLIELHIRKIKEQSFVFIKDKAFSFAGKSRICEKIVNISCDKTVLM